tara:strand:+ start:37 stop:363 length:327 start_codon:yes stop_codon:yes gene_type:complete
MSGNRKVNREKVGLGIETTDDFQVPSLQMTGRFMGMAPKKSSKPKTTSNVNTYSKPKTISNVETYSKPKTTSGAKAYNKPPSQLPKNLGKRNLFNAGGKTVMPKASPC